MDGIYLLFLLEILFIKEFLFLKANYSNQFNASKITCCQEYTFMIISIEIARFFWRGGWRKKKEAILMDHMICKWESTRLNQNHQIDMLYWWSCPKVRFNFDSSIRILPLIWLQYYFNSRFHHKLNNNGSKVIQIYDNLFQIKLNRELLFFLIHRDIEFQSIFFESLHLNQ